jgi:hypothetical protein
MPSIRRILHLAPFNTSGVPITLVRAERELGFESRLITLGHDPRGYEEDVCLDLPFLDSILTRWAKKIFSNPARLEVTNLRKIPAQIPPAWAPHSLPEKWLRAMRETLWQKKLQQRWRKWTSGILIFINWKADWSFFVMAGRCAN